MLIPQPTRIAQCLAVFLAITTLCGTAAAQDLPDNIPDGPRSVPEKQRDQLTERHRDVISRFFTGAQFSAAPAWTEGPSTVGFQFEAGFDVDEHDAIYITFGAREYVAVETMRSDSRGAPGLGGGRWSEKEVNALFSVNCETGLARYLDDTAFGRRAAVGVGVGFVGGAGPGMLSVEIGPTYVLPINPHWSLPVGVKIGQTLVGARSAQVRGTFFGLSIGVKRFYGHRDHLR